MDGTPVSNQMMEMTASSSQVKNEDGTLHFVLLKKGD